jgi:murein L,D-transpeptidase YcbB/YkuD
VQQLAGWLLQKESRWDQGRISQTIQSGQAQTVKLKRPVPVHFTYLSAWGTGDGVANFRIDIYDKDAIKARGGKLLKWEMGSRSVAP